MKKQITQKKAPAYISDFPFNPEKILASVDVKAMNAAEFGTYCKLLFASWTQTPQCFLKLDEHTICELCKLTPEQWNEVKHRVIKKFKLIYNNGEPFIYNEKLLGIYNNLLRGNKTQRGQQLSAVSDLLSYTFDQFWNDYAKKVGDKNRLLPKWLKLSDADREAIRQDIPKRKELQPRKHLRPNPETYLNGRRWEDEYIDARSPAEKSAASATTNYNDQKSNPV